MNYSKQENEKKRIAYKSKSKKVLNKGWLICVRIFVAVLIIGFFSAAGAVFGAYLGILENTPKVDFLGQADGNFDSIVYLDSTNEEVDRYTGGENREYVAYENIPQYLKDAFVAIEDKRFYEHNGVDFQGMVRAVFVMLSSDKTEGASTITQQLIKNKLGLLSNSFETKIQEQYLAVKCEEVLTEKLGSKKAAKEYILGLYLNLIGLGESQIGVQAASLFYFDKDVSELTLSECAVLAATTQKPTKNSPLKHPENNIKRRDYVLEVMLEMGTITQDEYDEAMADDPYGTISSVSAALMEQPSFHSYYNDAMFNQIVRDLMEQKGLSKVEANNLIYNGGLSIYSLQDTRIQKIVDEAYLDEANFPDNEYALQVEYIASVKNNVTGKTTNFSKTEVVKNQEQADAFVERMRNELSGLDKVIDDRVNISVQPQSGFVVMDQSTGYVRAISGGRGEKQVNRGFNRATDADRSPGSVFKVLASYAPAIDMGLITPATIIDDVPTKIGGYEPSNWDQKNQFKGLTTVREAIKDSMNICAVKNMYNTGVDNCLRYLKEFGLPMVDDDYNLSTALGGITNGVSPIDLAAAYSTIANQGYYNKPILYSRVLDHDGNVLLENTPQPKEVLKKTTAYLLLDIMKDVVRAGTGGQAQFKKVSMPIAGKTGTSSLDKDLCFVASTPYYTASIWLGYDIQASMHNYGSVHLRLWSKIMEQVHAELPYKDFEVPSGLTTATICMESGMLAGELCKRDPRGDRTRTEIFVKGTQPTEVCSVHREYDICKDSGLLATENCPQESVEHVVGIVRPIPYEGDDKGKIADAAYEFGNDVLEGKTCEIHNGFGVPTEAPDGPDISVPGEETQGPGYIPPMDTFSPYVPFNPFDTPTPEPTPYVPLYTDAPPDVTLRP